MVDNWFTESSQFKRGMDVEAFLDRYFGTEFDIKPTSEHQERILCLGDRIYRKEDETFFVEYKSGIQTHYTGNVFFETISVDNPCKPGWVYTCQADWLLYAALLDRLILVFKPEILRQQIAELKSRFPEKPTSKGQNKGYNTYGVIVPLEYAKTLTAKVIDLEQCPNQT
jgi:hypothetical protein